MFACNLLAPETATLEQQQRGGSFVQLRYINSPTRDVRHASFTSTETSGQERGNLII